MATCTSNFHFDGTFYAAGTDVPAEVRTQVGQHLFDSQPVETPAPSKPSVTPNKDAQSDSEPSEDEATKDEAYFTSLSKDDLVEEARLVGISGRNTKDELIAKLVEHYG